ncbi:MAG: phage scaffolding protein [Christensenellales bacterium]|jgi:glycyl-tRNA synthetase beta subunit
MKRDWLRQLGLDGEIIDSIMAENGRDIKAALEKQGELAKAQDVSTEESSNEETAKLRAEIAELKEQHETAIANMTAESAIENALSSYGAKNTKIVRAALDMSKITFAEGRIIGLKEQMDELFTAEPYLFDRKPDEDFRPVKISFAKAHGEAAEPDDKFFVAFSHAAGLADSE